MTCAFTQEIHLEERTWRNVAKRDEAHQAMTEDLHAKAGSRWSAAFGPQLGGRQQHSNTYELYVRCKDLLRLLRLEWRQNAGPVKALQPSNTIDLTRCRFDESTMQIV